MEWNRFLITDEEDKLDGQSNYEFWWIKVKTMLQLEEVWDELNFEANPAVVAAEATTNAEAEAAVAQVENAIANNNPANGECAVINNAANEDAARNLRRMKVKAKVILVFTVKDKFLHIIDKFDTDPVACWHHLRQRYGRYRLQRYIDSEEIYYNGSMCSNYSYMQSRWLREPQSRITSGMLINSPPSSPALARKNNGL